MPVPKTVAEARSVPVSVTDITDLKEAERVLADERQKLQEIVWGTGTGTWEWYVQTGKTVFNERWAEIVGYSLRELEPTSLDTWVWLVHPDDLKKSNAAIEDVCNKINEYYECTLRMRHKDGFWVWVLDRGRVAEWADDGKPLRMSGTHTDITTLKKAEIQAYEHVLYSEALLHFQNENKLGRTQDQMMQKLADILAASMDFSLVWIGAPYSEDVKTFIPIASAGRQIAFLKEVSVCRPDVADSDGPCGFSILQNRVYVSDNLNTDLCCSKWKEAANKYDLRSVAVLPIVINDDIKYAINLYSEDAGKFSNNDITFLSEFANNLSLALQINQATAEAIDLKQKIYDSALSALTTIAATIEQRDPYTSGHQRSSAVLAVAIAKKMGLSEENIEGIRLGATVHDIGKVHIPADILNYPRALTEFEYEIVKAHPLVGYEILESTAFPWPIKEMILQHHERLDGSGYPNGLKGDDIIAEAKVLAVADVVDAMTSHRPYRAALSVEDAIAEIEGGRGTLYDPATVDACVQLLNDKTFSWDQSLLV